MDEKGHTLIVNKVNSVKSVPWSEWDQRIAKGELIAHKTVDQNTGEEVIWYEEAS